MQLSRKYRTNRDFAKTIGVREQHLFQWMNEVCLPNTESIKKICETTHVSADWLIGTNARNPLSENGMIALRGLGEEEKVVLEWGITSGERNKKLLFGMLHLLKEQEL